MRISRKEILLLDILFKDMLSDSEKDELYELCITCNANDGTCYSAPSDADIYGLMKDSGRLICAVCAYHMGGRRDDLETDEIYAFTLPEFRKTGCFSSVLSFLLPVLRDVLVFPVYKINEAVLGALSCLKAKKDYDEYFMERSLNEIPGPGEISDEGITRHREASQDEVFFSSRFCECRIMRYSEDCLYLYGMLTYARYQGKGYGFEFLSRIIEMIERGEISFGSEASANSSEGSCRCGNSSEGGIDSEAQKHGFKRIILQVSSENTPAVKLYKKCGFSVKDSLSFYNVYKKDINLKNI